MLSKVFVHNLSKRQAAEARMGKVVLFQFRLGQVGKYFHVSFVDVAQ